MRVCACVRACVCERELGKVIGKFLIGKGSPHLSEGSCVCGLNVWRMYMNMNIHVYMYMFVLRVSTCTCTCTCLCYVLVHVHVHVHVCVTC